MNRELINARNETLKVSTTKLLNYLHFLTERFSQEMRNLLSKIFILKN